MKTVVAIGELLIDFVPQQKGCALDEVVQFERVAGGAPANVATAVARLGGHSRMVSQVGEDAFGTHILKVLNAANVDTSSVFRTNRANTALAFVSLDKTGNREFSFYRNPSADLFLDETQIAPEMFENCAALHFCSVDLVDWPVRQAHVRAIELAKQAGAPYADLVKLSDDEIEFVTGCADEREAAEKLFAGGAKMVVVTRGASGSAVYTPKASAETETIAVPVTDTTGAGDSFIGSFLYQLTRDGVTADTLSALPESRLAAYLRFSARCASLTVQRKGAAMPTLEEVREAYPD